MPVPQQLNILLVGWAREPALLLRTGKMPVPQQLNILLVGWAREPALKS